MDNFEKHDIKKSIQVHYPTFMYHVMVVTALFAPMKTLIRKIKVFIYIKKLK